MLTLYAARIRKEPRAAGTQFTLFTSTNVQRLTRQKALLDLGGYGLVGRPLSRDGRLESEDWRRDAHTPSSVAPSARALEGEPVLLASGGSALNHSLSVFSPFCFASTKVQRLILGRLWG